MIVMGVPGVLIAGQPVPEAHFAGQSGFAQELHGPVYGGLSERRIFPANPVIHFFSRKMTAFRKENFHNPLTLRRITQALVFQEGAENMDGILL